MKTDKISVVDLMVQMDLPEGGINKWKEIIRENQVKTNNRVITWRKNNIEQRRKYEREKSLSLRISRNPRIAFDFFEGVYYKTRPLNGKGWTYYDSKSRGSRCRSCNGYSCGKPKTDCKSSDHLMLYERRMRRNREGEEKQ